MLNPYIGVECNIHQVWWAPFVYWNFLKLCNCLPIQWYGQKSWRHCLQKLDIPSAIYWSRMQCSAGLWKNKCMCVSCKKHVFIFFKRWTLDLLSSIDWLVSFLDLLSSLSLRDLFEGWETLQCFLCMGSYILHLLVVALTHRFCWCGICVLQGSHIFWQRFWFWSEHQVDPLWPSPGPLALSLSCREFHFFLIRHWSFWLL